MIRYFVLYNIFEVRTLTSDTSSERFHLHIFSITPTAKLRIRPVCSGLRISFANILLAIIFSYLSNLIQFRVEEILSLTPEMSLLVFLQFNVSEFDIIMYLTSSYVRVKENASRTYSFRLCKEITNEYI